MPLNTRLDGAAPRLADEPLRDGGADHRPRVLADDGRGAPHPRRTSTDGRPIVIDVCDSEYTGPGERIGEPRIRGADRRARRRSRGSKGRPTSGTPSPSATPRARPATPRASSPIIAAPISTRCATPSPGPCRTSPSISGRCRCSTATAGASRGRWRCSAAPMSASGGSRRPRSSRRCATTRPTTIAARRSSTAMLINAPPEAPRGHRPPRPRHGRRRRAVGRDDRGHGEDRHRPHPRLWADRGLRARPRSA